MSYCDASYADAYLGGRAFSGAWTGDAKALFLQSATDFIKQFATFYDDDGNGFVYEEDETEIPDWLKDACCEEALYLMTLNKDPSAADKKTSLGIRSTDGTVFDKAFAADILAPACRRLLVIHGGILDGGATAGSAVQWGYIDK